MKKIIQVIIILFGCSMAIYSNGNSESTTDTIIRNDNVNPDILVEAPFQGWIQGLPKIEAPDGFDWKLYEGVKLNFISENTTPSTALTASIDQFTSVTGIEVNIEQADLSVVVEKVGLDINSGSAKYALVYADPYQILAKNYNSFVDLNKFNNDKYLPHLPGGVSDFFESQMTVCGYMNDTNTMYAIPYDCPTIVLGYRTDVFLKYKDLFMSEKGYDWTPSKNMTWDQYLEVSQWINEKVESGIITEVKYGTGHQAAQYDSLQCDFSNVLSAFGGDYFNNPELGSIGSVNAGKSAVNSSAGLRAAKFYKELLSTAAPGSTSWDWSGLSDAFSVGDIAMCPEWHEFSASWENPSSSSVVGKVSWEILPKGPNGSKNIFGGTGIAISKNATPREQEAAWLFVVWATSPQVQYSILKSDVGGSTPTRYSVYELDDVQKGMISGTKESKEMPNLLSSAAVMDAWKIENTYMRPKTPLWPQFDSIIYTELSNMLADKKTPEEAMNAIAKQCDNLSGN